MRFFRGSAMQLVQIFNLMNLIVDTKLIIIRKLQEMRQVTNTFVRTDDGLKLQTQRVLLQLINYQVVH